MQPERHAVEPSRIPRLHRYRRAVRRLQSEDHLPKRLALHAFFGQRQARCVAAVLLECPAVVGSAEHGRAKAESLLVGTQRLRDRGISPCTEHTLCLAGSRAMRQVQAAGCNGPSKHGLVQLGIRIGQAARPLFLDEYAVAGHQLHQAGDDLMQQRPPPCIGGRRHIQQRRDHRCCAGTRRPAPGCAAPR